MRCDGRDVVTICITLQKLLPIVKTNKKERQSNSTVTFVMDLIKSLLLSSVNG
jgi:hypothetical protein